MELFRDGFIMRLRYWLIEILSGDAKTKTVSTRSDFFDNLTESEVSEHDIEFVCRAFHRVHIQMNRK